MIFVPNTGFKKGIYAFVEINDWDERCYRHLSIGGLMTRQQQGKGALLVERRSGVERQQQLEPVGQGGAGLNITFL